MSATADDPAAMQATWNYPVPIHFGAGRVKELAKVCRSLGISRPLVVTDPDLAVLPMLTRERKRLAGEGLAPAVFSEVRGNPTGASVDAGAEACRGGGHDGVIAFGGGSALDAGKAIAFMAGQSGRLWDYRDARQRSKAANAEAILPIVAVPTTAGTGSEVSFASVITEEEAGAKRIVYHPRMKPSAVVADPELTLGLPPHLTAATGLDALSHCIEALSAPIFHPMSEGIALEGLRRIHDWLPVAVREPDNLMARAQMLAAASMGAVAFERGLGAVHALSHSVGARYETHHGLTNAVVLPYVLLYNRPAIEAQMTRLARFLDLPQPGFAGVLAWIDDLRARFSVPETLAALGVEEDALPELARLAAEDITAGTNPRPLDEAAALALLRKARAGQRD